MYTSDEKICLYEFYTHQYSANGEMPFSDFSRLLQRAEAKLRQYERAYTVRGSDEEKKSALCAVIDVLHRFEILASEPAVTSTTVGSVSTGFAAPQTDLSPRAQERELYRAASEHLSIYRGVG